ncbi:hypothetical protein Patl1_17648 [Pistacia atlantica]|uniref:Uncharacterized protein n=1 Tax=Pistacia atlantica TaxID=434234 RepID=A0ACC1BY95_9ROSI|nr:hypothetical protein Patl1_17648 [Pistacia atlantica]
MLLYKRFLLSKSLPKGSAYPCEVGLNPRGTGEAKGSYISLYLFILGSSIPNDTKLFVNSILRVKDQMNEEDFLLQNTL